MRTIILSLIILLSLNFSFSQLTTFETIYRKIPTNIEILQATTDNDSYLIFNYYFKNDVFNSNINSGGFSFFCESEILQFANDIESVYKSESKNEILRRSKYRITERPDLPYQISIWDKSNKKITLYGGMVSATLRDIKYSLEYWDKESSLCR